MVYAVPGGRVSFASSPAVGILSPETFAVAASHPAALRAVWANECVLRLVQLQDAVGLRVENDGEMLDRNIPKQISLPYTAQTPP